MEFLWLRTYSETLVAVRGREKAGVSANEGGTGRVGEKTHEPVTTTVLPVSRVEGSLVVPKRCPQRNEGGCGGVDDIREGLRVRERLRGKTGLRMNAQEASKCLLLSLYQFFLLLGREEVASPKPGTSPRRPTMRQVCKPTLSSADGTRGMRLAQVLEEMLVLTAIKWGGGACWGKGVRGIAIGRGTREFRSRRRSWEAYLWIHPNAVVRPVRHVPALFAPCGELSITDLQPPIKGKIVCPSLPSPRLSHRRCPARRSRDLATVTAARGRFTHIAGGDLRVLEAIHKGGVDLSGGWRRSVRLVRGSGRSAQWCGIREHRGEEEAWFVERNTGLERLEEKVGGTSRREDTKKACKGEGAEFLAVAGGRRRRRRLAVKRDDVDLVGTRASG